MKSFICCSLKKSTAKRKADEPFKTIQKVTLEKGNLTAERIFCFKDVFYSVAQASHLSCISVLILFFTSLILLVYPTNPIAACRRMFTGWLSLEPLGLSAGWRGLWSCVCVCLWWGGGWTCVCLCVCGWSERGQRGFFCQVFRTPAGSDLGLTAVVQALDNWLLTTRRSPRRLSLTFLITRLVTTARRSGVGFQSQSIQFLGRPAETSACYCGFLLFTLTDSFWRFQNSCFFGSISPPKK